MRRLASKRFSGFTLIELLVVISIIALLIGILLPALGKARESGRASVCLGHMRGAGQGVAVYAADNEDWLPGPNTSGWRLTLLNNAYVFQNIASEPVQNTDWMSPTLAGSLGLAADRVGRIKELFNEEFKCPSNQQKFTSQNGGSTPGLNPTELTVVSYSAMTGFHGFGQVQSGDPVGTPTDVWDKVRPPTNYRPRLDKVGQASIKAFAMDGSRYVNKGDGTVTYNVFPRQLSGGNYMDYGPSVTAASGGTPYDRTTEARTALSRIFAYRHSDRLNIGFYDGHAEARDQTTAQLVEASFPSGSTIINAAGTDDPNDANGVVR